MAFVNEIKKTVAEATPVYAAVGVTDLAVEKVRDARVKAAAVRKDVNAKTIQKDLTAQAEKAAKQVQEAPAQLLNRSLVIAGKAQEQYDALAVRGEKLVKRIRTQKATKDLIAQVDQTVAAGKGAVTTVRRAVADTRQSARATLTTGRKEAERLAGSAVKGFASTVDALEQDADVAIAEVKTAAARTRTAVKRTATTAEKSAATATSRTKAAATTARKSAATARKATETAATKVGD